MAEILNSFGEAIKLLISGDVEIYGIILLTLVVTIVSTSLASLMGVSFGVLLGSCYFRGRAFVLRIVNTFMGVPPVVAGLVVYLLLSNKGPFGSFKLLFTPAAMVIAQVIIITPIITGLCAAATRNKALQMEETCRGLDLKRGKTLFLILKESRYAVISAVLAGYGRAISEVGAVILVGGNIQYHTRIMTTSIVLETSKGEYGKALALGILLLSISFIVNLFLQKVQEG